MGKAAPRPCTHPGCGVLVHDGGRCPRHVALVRHETDQRRAQSGTRIYGSRWKRARAAFLRDRPLCTQCGQSGLLRPAIVVDHITPHGGDMTLFWEQDNWQSMCKPCHDRKTATIDGGFGRVRK
jgi:5-methylcytosine-specific restriction protein A